MPGWQSPIQVPTRHAVNVRLLYQTHLYYQFLNCGKSSGGTLTSERDAESIVKKGLAFSDIFQENDDKK